MLFSLVDGSWKVKRRGELRLIQATAEKENHGTSI
jgi:hypothetical protein